MRKAAADPNDQKTGLTDELVESLMFSTTRVPGSIGMALVQFPETVRQSPQTYKPAILALLKKVDVADPISESEFAAFRTALKGLHVPSAIINRIVSLCFPTQLANTVTDAAMDELYRKLVASGILDEIPVNDSETRWFVQNCAVSDCIRSVIPNTDDAWRSCLIWTLR